MKQPIPYCRHSRLDTITSFSGVATAVSTSKWANEKPPCEVKRYGVKEVEYYCAAGIS